MNKAERLWNLRDGVLAWLYGLRVDGAASLRPRARIRLGRDYGMPRRVRRRLLTCARNSVTDTSTNPNCTFTEP